MTQPCHSTRIPSILILKLFRRICESSRTGSARLQEGGNVRQRTGKVDLMSFAVPYWLSIPMPIQMMGRGYVAWNLADKNRRRRDEPTLRRSQRDRLHAPKVWPHPQLRVLSRRSPLLHVWRLPWVARHHCLEWGLHGLVVGA